MEKLRRNWFFYSSSIQKYMGGKVSGGERERENKRCTHKSEKSPRHLQREREREQIRRRESVAAAAAEGNFGWQQAEIHICVINSTCPLIVKVKNGYARAKWFFRCRPPQRTGLFAHKLSLNANTLLYEQAVSRSGYKHTRGLKHWWTTHTPLPLFGWRSRHTHTHTHTLVVPSSMKNDDSRH